MSLTNLNELRRYLTTEAGYTVVDVDKWLSQFVERDYAALLANPHAVIESYPITALEEEQRLIRIHTTSEKYAPIIAADLFGPDDLDD